MEKVLGLIEKEIDKGLFAELIKIYSFIDTNYNAEETVYKDSEIRFKCGGKNLATVRVNGKVLSVLIIFGKAQRDKFDIVRNTFSQYIQNIYDSSKTYHDGKWMSVEIKNSKQASEIIEMIKIKKQPNPKTISMCGYKCGLCKAYIKNVRKNDQRQEQQNVWKKYYKLNISTDDMKCDGCRSEMKEARCLDSGCPVRSCVTDKKIGSCANCGDYPCEIFFQREGLCYANAKDMQKESISEEEFETYLRAFDNKTRLDRLRSNTV